MRIVMRRRDGSGEVGVSTVVSEEFGRRTQQIIFVALTLQQVRHQIMQWVLAILIAAFLVIAGVQILHVILVDWMQLYKDITLEEACLIFLVVLQTATLVQLILWRREIEWDRNAQQPPAPRPAERPPKPKQPVKPTASRRKAAGSAASPSEPRQSRRASGDQRYYGSQGRSSDPRHGRR